MVLLFSFVGVCGGNNARFLGVVGACEWRSLLLLLCSLSLFSDGNRGLCGEVDARGAGTQKFRDVCKVDFDERRTRMTR